MDVCYCLFVFLTHYLVALVRVEGPTAQIYPGLPWGRAYVYLFQLCTSKAYQKGDLSLVYPLSNLTPLFVPLWAVWFLHERLSLPGIGGILLTAMGAGLIQFSACPLVPEHSDGRRACPVSQTCLRVTHRQAGDLKANKRVAFWALGASFFASIGAVLDKAGVQVLPPPLMYHYVALMVTFMLLFLTLWVWFRFPPKVILAEIKHHPSQILFGGIMLAGSFLFFRYGIKICPISYAVAIRRVSILLSVWLGMIVFKEAHGFARMVASILIIAGLVLLRLA